MVATAPIKVMAQQVIIPETIRDGIGRIVSFAQLDRNINAIHIYYDGAFVGYYHNDTRQPIFSSHDSFPMMGAEGIFACLLTAFAVDDGWVNWDDTVEKYLPSWSAPAYRKVTLRQLLNHTSGMDLHQIFDPSPHKLPMLTAPPETFMGLNPAGYQYAAKAISVALSKHSQTITSYLRQKYFNPTGSSIKKWETTEEIPVFYRKNLFEGGLELRFYDWIKLAEFIRLQGVWQQKHLLKWESLLPCFQGSKYNPAVGVGVFMNIPLGRQQVYQYDLGKIFTEIDGSLLEFSPRDFLMISSDRKNGLIIIPSMKLSISISSTLMGNLEMGRIVETLLPKQ
ncbi:MAG: serine hydrolase [Alphaproteobacteria bacterium]